MMKIILWEYKYGVYVNMSVTVYMWLLKDYFSR